MNDKEITFIKAHIQAIHQASGLILDVIDDLDQEQDGSYEQGVVLVQISTLLDELKHSYCASAKHVNKHLDGAL